MFKIVKREEMSQGTVVLSEYRGTPHRQESQAGPVRDPQGQRNR